MRIQKFRKVVEQFRKFPIGMWIWNAGSIPELSWNSKKTETWTISRSIKESGISGKMDQFRKSGYPEKWIDTARCGSIFSIHSLPNLWIQTRKPESQWFFVPPLHPSHLFEGEKSPLIRAKNRFFFLSNKIPADCYTFSMDS